MNNCGIYQDSSVIQFEFCEGFIDHICVYRDGDIRIGFMRLGETFSTEEFEGFMQQLKEAQKSYDQLVQEITHEEE